MYAQGRPNERRDTRGLDCDVPVPRRAIRRTNRRSDLRPGQAAAQDLPRDCERGHWTRRIAADLSAEPHTHRTVHAHVKFPAHARVESNGDAIPGGCPDTAS